VKKLLLLILLLGCSGSMMEPENNEQAIVDVEQAIKTHDKEHRKKDVCDNFSLDTLLTDTIRARLPDYYWLGSGDRDHIPPEIDGYEGAQYHGPFMFFDRLKDSPLIGVDSLYFSGIINDNSGNELGIDSVTLRYTNHALDIIEITEERDNENPPSPVLIVEVNKNSFGPKDTVKFAVITIHAEGYVDGKVHYCSETRTIDDERYQARNDLYPIYFAAPKDNIDFCPINEDHSGETGYCSLGRHEPFRVTYGDSRIEIFDLTKHPNYKEN